ncbi:LytTR family DNA-binding domain-containing protein [Chryseobacterium suipulveris]|jgi:two-component system LytT family response regulator|uniref:LytTR family DNA-binding domain-containing protein n=1 Tax=Chryseobacterium suipulveris TaxID=2929800 RepID=A0ABY4BNH6_9FLAO|nr:MULTISPECIES: LytTR family DNA-binding domain-containing protein [Chryseobacterium group]UOE40715.1 LytTR family DNA-binding domain-containing protein [Chryseobacterium suipulveris]
MKAIIIEDEKRAQIYLKGVINQVAPEIEVVAICDDLPSGVLAIRKFQPEMVFLDIEMPKYNGLEIVNFFGKDEIQFNIIFTTAYNQYAIQAFKTSALDYLLKPIDPEELKETMERYKQKQLTTFHKLQVAKLSIAHTERIAIPDGNNLIMIEVNEILYLKADSNYTDIHLTNGKKYTTSRILKNFEETLSSYSQFFRCHKSYIINILHTLKFSRVNGGTIVLKNDVEIPISIEKTDTFLKAFKKIPRF